MDMKDQAVIYAKLQFQSLSPWEQEEKPSYDAQKLADEYHDRLYSVVTEETDKRSRRGRLSSPYHAFSCQIT